MFELRLNNNTIPLQWGTWAMKRFCELENKSLMELIKVLSSGSFELKTIINIVLASPGDVRFLRANVVSTILSEKYFKLWVK